MNDTLRTVAVINPDAESIAIQLDRERANGILRGPLHGIPILIKDNIGTADKMENTAGSYALAGCKITRDSTMAANLRKAGAIILGKTTLSEWARFRSSNTTNGWSALTGQTEGAYFPQQDPSGSSSGSGVACSMGLAVSCLGTETDGSITMPSDQGNLVGIKPTVGLTSRDLVIPISEHQDTIGPMSRTVKDAAYLLSAIAGKSPYDNYTSAIPFEKIPDYVGACKLSALQGKRIGIPRNLIDLTIDSPEYPIISAFNAALDIFRAAGATIIDNTNFTGYDDYLASDDTRIIMKADFMTSIPKYFSQLSHNPNDLHSVADLLDFTHNHELEEWPLRDTKWWEESVEAGFDNTSPEFWSHYTYFKHLAGALGVTGALQNHSLDALIIPTRFGTHFPAILGSPIITVPLGSFPTGTPIVKDQFGRMNQIAPNIPFGISFLGPRFSEELLIGLAYAFEQRTLVRNSIKPYIQPSFELKDLVKRRKHLKSAAQQVVEDDVLNGGNHNKEHESPVSQDHSGEL